MIPKILEQLRHCAHGCSTGNCPHDRKFRAVLQEAGITLPEKPNMTACAGLQSMKTAPFNLNKALAGHPLITRGGKLVTGFKQRFGNDNMHTLKYPYFCGPHSYTAKGCYLTEGESSYDLFLSLPDDPPLSPEEQAVIDAMRAGRKVTVEEPPKPAMPRRCWDHFNPAAGEYCDPWINVFGLEQECFVGKKAKVQLIELTPEVSTALLAAGIRWEDAPTGNQLPDGLPPLPEGTVYLGVGKSFEVPKGGFSGFTTYGGDDPWEWQDKWAANSKDLHYAAPADSEIVWLNKVG